MRTSIPGICAMLAEEAIVLSTYDDGNGVATIGAGHTAAAGTPIPQWGMKISLTEALNIYRIDIANVERAVSDTVKVRLSQNQFDALVSWHFNTGAIRNATLTSRLNAGDYSGAADEFARWNKDGGKVVNGLVARRQRETEMFLKGDYGTPHIRVMDAKGGHEEVFDAGQIEGLLGGAPANEEDQSTDALLANPTSRLLPRNRPQQSPEVTRAILTKFETLLPPDRRMDKVVLVAVRGYYLNTLGKEGVNDRGLYDDAIFVLEPDRVHNFNGNTDPGRSQPGIAQLKSRQAVRYIPGLHGFSRKEGPYPAFRQDSDCTVIRDKVGEDTDTAATRFWINLHRGGNTTTSSLGCQTVPPHQWNEFKALVDSLLQMHQQKSFYYLLVEQADIPKEEPIMITSPQMQTTVPTGIVLATSQPTAATTVAQIQDLATALMQIQARLKALTDVIDMPPSDPLVSKADPTLTPVNGALGKAVGNALDGRKTAIGVIGMLATTVLPIFFPQLAPVVTAAGPLLDAAGNAISNSAGATAAAANDLPQALVKAAFPIFSTLAGWGVLGKVEKWVRAIRG